MTRVLVAGKIHPHGLARLESRSGLEVVEMARLDAAAFLEQLPTAGALLIRTAPLPADAIARADKLRVVSRHGVGFDNVPVEALTAKGIPLVRIGDVTASSVAEHALALMLALAKRIPYFDAAVRSNDWAIRNRFTTVELQGRVLLIMGLGRIGREVARRAAAFGMILRAYDPMVSAAEMRALGVEAVGDWRVALGEADVITLHLPRNATTENMIGAGELAAMKASAFLINTARGGLIDEAALAEALRAGRIAGAGIDVLDQEPPAKDHPLFGIESAILSPHMASMSEEGFARMSMAAADNVLAGLDGRLDPSLVVNPEVLKR